MNVNEKISGGEVTESPTYEEMYEKYKNIIKNYYKNSEVPETDEEEDKKYIDAVNKGYEIYLKKSKVRQKQHPKDKWVMIIKGIREEGTRGGKRRKHKQRRTKKKSRKAKKKTKRSRR